MTGFRDIRDALLARIRSGALAPGAVLPSEVELAEEFGVARATVSRAVGELAAEGLVERRRRAGTRVRRAPARRAQIDILQAQAEIERAGGAYSYRLLDPDYPVPADIAARLGPARGLLCLHLSDARPWQAEERWIGLDDMPATPVFDQRPPGPWLVEQVPLTDAVFSFEAAATGHAVAAGLGIRPGTTVFVAERSTWLDGRAITATRLWHLPGYRMELRHSPGGAGPTG